MDLYVMPDKNETKWSKLKRKGREKAQQALTWVKCHPDDAAVLATIVAGAASMAINIVGKVHKRNDIRRAEDLRTKWWYDPCLGKYWELRRKLSNQEIAIVDARRQAGERLSDILMSMDVLK